MPALRYLALGDSYTIGEGVDADARWPAQLATRLREAGIEVAAPRVIATTGWTTDELAAGIAAEQPLGMFDFVTLGIGVNDQYRGRSLAEYRAQLAPLLDSAIALADAHPERVLTPSIPDWGATPFAREKVLDAGVIAREIDAFNEAAREMCEARGIAFVDVTASSRVHGADPRMLVADGLHPSAAMYACWVDEILPAARRLLAA